MSKIHLIAHKRTDNTEDRRCQHDDRRHRLDAQDQTEARAEGNKAIAKAPGLGPKSAARIILELKDKISKDMMSSGSKNLDTPPIKIAIGGNIAEASEALAVLGYDKNTILSVLKGIDPSTEVGEIVKTALKKLTR